jgi:hypothetical protein
MNIKKIGHSNQFIYSDYILIINFSQLIKYIKIMNIYDDKYKEDSYK